MIPIYPLFHTFRNTKLENTLKSDNKNLQKTPEIRTGLEKP